MGQVNVPSVQLFTPNGVQTFGVIDPIALNANLNAIASAFNFTLIQPHANTQIAALQDEVLADTYTPWNTAITLTLPQNPSVGNPPINIVLAPNGGSAQTPYLPVSITTADGSLINGIAPNVGLTNVPVLRSAGDFLSFTYVDSQVGWLVTGILGAFVPTFLGVPINIWQGQFGLYAAGNTVPVDSIQMVGAWFAVATSSIVGNLSIGDSSSTFNGNAGPYVIHAASGAFRFNRVLCIGPRTFEVDLI